MVRGGMQRAEFEGEGGGEDFEKCEDKRKVKGKTGMSKCQRGM